MEQSSDYEKQWAKGFADGVLLSVYEPELAGQLPKMDGKTTSPFLKGLSHGIAQYDRRRDFLANLAKTRNENTETDKPKRR